jgi:undecaprenyl-phosphate 4-deoxy-4-formamido-L-arabinose transferase
MGMVTIILIISIYFSIIIFSIGILGEYIGRIFNEVKRRPTYIIESEYL